MTWVFLQVFRKIKIHEARTREDREYLDVQMEKDSPWIVVSRSPSLTQHPWRLGRREACFRQREEIESHSSSGLISSVRQRLAKRCLVLVEDTWIDEQGVLSELSGIVDSVTGESFEVLRGVSPQLDTAWGVMTTAREPRATKIGTDGVLGYWENVVGPSIGRPHNF